MEQLLEDVLGCAMVPWEYNDPAKFSQGHGKLSETAIYARGNAFPWRMAEVQCSDEKTEIATARLMAAAPDLYIALTDLIAANQPPISSKAKHTAYLNAKAALDKAAGIVTA